MIVAGSGLKVVVATRPVDFRKGHDGLVAVVEHELGLDPYSGVVFVFRPKRVDFLEAHEGDAPIEVVLDVDATDDPLRLTLLADKGSSNAFTSTIGTWVVRTAYD